jgi:hypothetical protein
MLTPLECQYCKSPVEFSSLERDAATVCGTCGYNVRIFGIFNGEILLRTSRTRHPTGLKMDRCTLTKSWIVSVDLHGLSTRTALEVVRTKVREAWENGCAEILFTHGAPDVTEWNPGDPTPRRGSIKWSIRELHKSNALTKWVQEFTSQTNSFLADRTKRSGETSFAIKPNLKPLDPPQFSAMPPLEYTYNRHKKKPRPST